MFIPKKILYGVGIIAILAVGIGIGLSLRNAPAPPAPLYPSKVEQAAAVTNAHQPSETNTTPSPVSPSTEGERFRVARVVDGDTIEVLINGKMERVRYIGIDTPETVDPRKPVQCFGVEAAKKNKELVEGKTVRLEKDITERDKYSRLLRYVWVGDSLINEALVAQGFASSYSYPPDIKYQERFAAAERHAREDKLGLWRACSSSDSSAPVSSPQQYSYIPTNVGMSAAEAPRTDSCTIKGNINASGEKIYHLQGCGSYAKTTIDERRGERWFCSESEAQSAGWRKALNCS